MEGIMETSCIPSPFVHRNFSVGGLQTIKIKNKSTFAKAPVDKTKTVNGKENN